MALRDCPHYNFMAAVKTVLDADTDIGLTNWRIQKLLVNRTKPWDAGGYICPLLAASAGGHENLNDMLVKRTLVAFVRPGDMSLIANLEDQMKKMHRIDEIFRNRGLTKIPAAISSLNDAAATQKWNYQKMTVEPAERFIASAFSDGYDASGVIIRAVFISARDQLDFS